MCFIDNMKDESYTISLTPPLKYGGVYIGSNTIHFTLLAFLVHVFEPNKITNVIQ
jgi:hypothetical protein